MNLEVLVGKTFEENCLYEVLHFDIQQNFKSYLSKFVHIYFDHLEASQIRINEIRHLEDQKALYVVNRQIIGVKSWIEIYDHFNQIDLMICRQDRSGKFSIIGPTLNFTQIFRYRCFDRYDHIKSPTPEEARQAFAELAGIFDDHVEISKPKIAV